jgi:hypothetical protein
MQMGKIIILLGALLASMLEGADATTRAGRASPYSAKLKSSKDNSCGLTAKSMDRQFVKMYAAISADDVEEEDGGVCGKCVRLSLASPSSTSRRFSGGVFAQIVDTKDSISSGELLLSHKAHKVTTKGARGGDLVSWVVVDCPMRTNLRGGRKMAAAEDSA